MAAAKAPSRAETSFRAPQSITTSLFLGASFIFRKDQVGLGKSLSQSEDPPGTVNLPDRTM